MPLPPPVIDDRDYRQLVDDTLARVPVHTPEWTNFNASDPGVTLVQLFAFLTENLIYRANQIPVRNRAKFLRLLGIGLNPAKEARGLVTFAAAKGPLAARTLPPDVELLAGKLPFRTVTGLAVLPVEARAYVKRPVTDASTDLRDYYKLLYASYDKNLDTSPTSLSLYQSVAFDPRQGPFDPDDTTDRSLWIAILARREDIKPTDSLALDSVRASLGAQTLSLGLSPAPDSGQRVLVPGAASTTANADALSFEIARPNANGELDFDSAGHPQPVWRTLTSRFDFDPTVESGVVELTLPPADELKLWSNLDPLEAGVGDLPPALEDPALNERVATWLRLRVANAANVRLNWVGINAAIAHQLETIRAERLSDGDGTTNQTRQLARAPVLAGSVALTSIRTDGTRVNWSPIDDLLAAEPEVPISKTEDLAPATSYRIDAEAGLITFGDGLAGERPALGERLYARYDICAGQAGNLAPGTIKEGVGVPNGITATNPIPTWGGADAEQVADGERQVQRFLHHRDRLVTAEDFRTIAFRTPGIAIGRIEVLPAWHPDLAPAALGSAPGVVTLMAIPVTDPLTPAAPRADDRFLGALCRYLDPRRLVTTELVLRGASYKGVWVSIGITVAGGHDTAVVTDAVKARVRAYLSPLPANPGFAASSAQLYGPDIDPDLRGWPLERPVHARAILAEAARVQGVSEIADVRLALGNGPAVDSIDITGIEMPEILGLSVVSGDPVDLAALRGDARSPGAEGGGKGGARLLPVPIVPETC